LKKSDYELTLTTTLLYLATFVLLNLFILSILAMVGFSLTNLIAVMGLAALPAALFGYLIAQHSLLSHFHTNALLKRLLRNTLHEIRIPIATIRANAQMLGRGADDRGQKRLERIDLATRKLEGLYEELEYYISREIQRVQKEPVALHDLIEERLEFLSEKLRNCQVQTHLEPCWVEADDVAIARVLDNLIDNAVKYSPPNRCQLTLKLASGQLDISDRGEGISTETLSRIFERYYQDNPHRSGYGIGLDIVKAACDEHRIGLSVDSKPDEGTTFSLDLTHVLIKKPQLQ
jgi:signal transduction histidine kinase